LFTRLDHIGIAVRSLGQAVAFWSELLEPEPDPKISVSAQGVEVVFFPTRGARLELLAATRPDSPITKFLEKQGEGLHHVCFAVKNVETTLAELKSKGVELIDEKPRIGAEGKKIAFLHPKSTQGVLIELLEE
jgi:methylmalonyl-CoA/ethylmalonyl-CoA epimerase